MTLRPQFAFADYVVLFLYALALVVVGAVTIVRRRQGRESASEDYMVAGRTVTLPAFVATLVATWYGGILGVGEMAYTTGIGTWTVFGLPYYLFAVVYALFLAHRVRNAARLTIPDTLQESYGRPCALLGAVFVFFVVTPAPYVLMLGTLLSGVFGWPLIWSLVLGTAVSVVFVITGGFRTDIRTNVIQFVLMFASFALILGFAVARYGGFGFLAPLPTELKSLTGGMPLSYVIVWYFIALWTLVDPGFHQRCSAARDARTARCGILISVCCWAVFDFLTVTTGLYARAALPDLKPAIDAYPAFSEILLPPGAKGFFWVGMLATIMSTVLSYTFIAAITLGRDIVWRLSPRHAEGRDVFWTRVGVLLTAALSIGAALALPTVVGLWYTIGTTFVPGLLVPLLTSYSERLRVPPAFMFTGMVLGTGLPMLWLVLGARAGGGLASPAYPAGWEPMYIGLGASALCWFAGVLARRAWYTARGMADTAR